MTVWAISAEFGLAGDGVVGRWNAVGGAWAVEARSFTRVAMMGETLANDDGGGNTAQMRNVLERSGALFASDTRH